jgi:hypothetical protein
MKALVQIIVVIAFLSPGSTAWSDNSGYVPAFGCDTGPFRLHLPKSFLALRSIGKIRSEKVLEVTDWGTYKSEDRELIFDGLKLIVITFTNDSKYMVARATITSSVWKFAGGFRVGDSVNSVMHRFNDKGSQEVEMLRFGGDTDSVDFSVSNGRVIIIDYSCYTG